MCVGDPNRSGVMARKWMVDYPRKQALIAAGRFDYLFSDVVPAWTQPETELSDLELAEAVWRQASAKADLLQTGAEKVREIWEEESAKAEDALAIANHQKAVWQCKMYKAASFAPAGQDVTDDDDHDDVTDEYE